ncbi:MAG: TIGR03986 family CRISPR-associated RAMP protein [Candidatus Marinimicrobia bacterium]|nr:TIGR03986 family CRISPR-associated RAMP protein [Candidatus Neomarinimicrobiota bacterium]
MAQQREFPPENPGPPPWRHDTSSHFIYPYNFVSHGGPRGREKSPGIGQDKGFKPLHRYDGLTGRIEYTITALTPIFIPDPEGVTIYKLGDRPEDIHKVMDFFNVDGQLCISPTSIKGMIRSVVEAATNSSFGVTSGEGVRFSYRKTEKFRRKVGRWTSDGKIEPLGIAKLPLQALRDFITRTRGGTPPTDDQLFQLQGNHIKIKVWKIHTGPPVVVWFELNGSQHDAIRLPDLSKIPVLSGQLSGRVIHSSGKSFKVPRDVISRLKIRNKMMLNFRWANFPELNNLPPRSGSRRVIEIRYDGQTWKAEDPRIYSGEIRFHCKFLDPEVQKSDKYVRVIYELDPPATPLDVSDEVKEAFRHANRETASGQKPPCRRNSRLPEPGEIVFYEQDRTTGRVIEFGPVAMFKSAENESLETLLQDIDQYSYPQSADSLCPATRLFGWTPEEREEEEEGKQGVAGRVSFSVAWSGKTLKDTHLVPLKILGSPKPQYYPFYLRPEPSQNKDPWKDVAYYTKMSQPPWALTPGTIRGRKFYLHHPKGRTKEALEDVKRKLEDLSLENIEEDEKERWKNIHTHQNATCAVLPQEVTFKGYIEFESLDPYELGMLLWALTISDNPLNESKEHAHKLGMGKGIGLGSIRFHIEKVIFTEPEKDWMGELEAVNEREATREELKSFVRRFKTWMLTGRDEDSKAEASRYDNLPFVKDLKAVLDINLIGHNVPIQYYPSYLKSDKAFEYFVDQRKTRPRNQEEPLRTPEAIKGGWRQGIS